MNMTRREIIGASICTIMHGAPVTQSATDRGKTPHRAGPYVTVYRPKPDVFPGPDTVSFRAGGIYERWVPNDHAIIKGRDGRWHAIGITHPKPPPEGRIHEGEFLSFHAASPVGTLRDVASDDGWFDLPKVLPPADRPGEKNENHAPYIIEHNQQYWMIYGPSPMRCATSPDLTRWTPRGELFKQEGGARDPNILIVDGTYYLTYVTGNSLLCRTAKVLGEWNQEPVEILRLEKGAPESPTLLRYDGAFYIFYAIWDGTHGPYDSRTFVHRSDDPLRFRGGPIAQLDAHAPEIFQNEEGAWWISSVEYPATGVSLAPLEWRERK